MAAPKKPKKDPNTKRDSDIQKAHSVVPSTAVPVPADLTITVSGTERAVRRTLTAMQFEEPWDPITTRHIAIEQTLAPGTGLDDTLAGDRVRLFSQDARDLYRQRCLNEASHRGHPVYKPSTIPADAETTVMEVGDALFDNSRH